MLISKGFFLTAALAGVAARERWLRYKKEQEWSKELEEIANDCELDFSQDVKTQKKLSDLDMRKQMLEVEMKELRDGLSKAANRKKSRHSEENREEGEVSDTDTTPGKNPPAAEAPHTPTPSGPPTTGPTTPPGPPPPPPPPPK